MVVDCLLPSQVRRLGNMTYAAARKAIKTTTSDCEIRGGEYVAYDRASYATSLKIWLPLAQEGDAEAQTYVGEIYEKGLGLQPDYATAAHWYAKAAEQGFSRAAINLGNLFEQGLGFEKDKQMALFWYQQASGKEGISPLFTPAQAPATITLIEPELDQRGLKIISANAKPVEEILVIGKVTSAHPLVQVTINGQPAKLIGDMFKGTADAMAAQLKIVVVDESKHETAVVYPLTEYATKASNSDYSTIGLRQTDTPDNRDYVALIIGNNDYIHLNHLDTAVADAKAIADILQREYGFKTKVLLDANRFEILSALNAYRTELSASSRLLIYYAGHGELDRINKRGHWLPINAEADNTANWISNISITDMLNIIPARQLMLIVDSCYSGMMSRSVLGVLNTTLSSEQKSHLLHALAGAKTRTAFTSGGVSPVLDSIDGQHSVFAKELILALQQNQGGLTGYELFQAITPNVTQHSADVGFNQTPEYAPLKFAGHEAGDFVFYKLSQKESAQ